MILGWFSIGRANMAILKKLFDFFGAKQHPRAAPPISSSNDTPAEDLMPENPSLRPRRLPSKIDDMMELGLTTHSKNKLWSVGYWDPGPDAARDMRTVSLRDNTSGKVVVKLEHILRPFSVDVSDVGVFAVEDAGLASELSSRVMAFDRAGKQLYERNYRANLAGFSISPCGRYLASQTCNSSNEDSFIFEIHDIAEQRILASRTPVTGLSDEFSFETENGQLKRVFAKVQKIGKFAYSPTGEFLDAKKHVNAQLTKGDPSTRIRAAEELVLSDSSEKALQRAMDAVDESIKELSAESSWLGPAYRTKGELLERAGRDSDAIEAYRVALKVNSKIGVKKRLTALEKAQSQRSLLTSQTTQLDDVP
jgi:hypothetical protein